MLKSDGKLIFVSATRLKGTNKNGNDYDFANIEVSDGIGSLEIPLEPTLAETVNRDFSRGQEIQVTVDVKKQFGRTAFLVTNVKPLAVAK
jgi:hypothetical protein